MATQFADTKIIEDSIREIFTQMGENPYRAGLIDTPARIVKMWREIFRGYDPGQRPKVTTFQNGEDGVVYDSMIVDSGSFYSVCEHHMLPFFGKYWFAYIPHPHGKIIGLSKIARVVDYCSARLQIQERLVHDIVREIDNSLQDKNPPLGIALMMEGEHLCKTMRGAKKQGKMIASVLTGVFKENAATQAEFMSFVNSDRK